ncbi:MAG: hypothetical protein QXI39_08580 [Candidatus Bathyarchaeia archaeon]
MERKKDPLNLAKGPFRRVKIPSKPETAFALSLITKALRRSYPW